MNCASDSEISLMDLMKELFPITRSLTGAGNRETLKILSDYADLDFKQVRTGERLFDWVVPQEWNVAECYVENINSGLRVIDFKDNNLHAVGYSAPIDKILTGRELKTLLISDENRPNSIPYVTSYYRKMSAICCTRNQYDEINDEEYYHIKINSSILTAF